MIDIIFIANLWHNIFSYDVTPKKEVFRIETIIKKERTPLDKWFDKVLPPLKKQESGGNWFAVNEGDALITGHPSIGCYQFQPPTFIAGINRYQLLPYAEKAEYMNFIYDCDFQEKLVKLMLQEDNGWRHWWTSFNLLGLPKHPPDN